MTFLSEDSGLTWTLTQDNADAPLSPMALSADGAQGVAVQYSGAEGILTFSAGPRRPFLNSASLGNKLTLSWLVPSSDFALQESSDLYSPNWTTLSATPTLNETNLHYEVSVPSPADTRFYRLKQP
jgi:hypothetical protein